MTTLLHIAEYVVPALIGLRVLLWLSGWCRRRYTDWVEFRADIAGEANAKTWAKR